MLDHFIQREIIYRLRSAQSLRFSELQPEGIENKLFNYHLKKVLRAKLIKKNDDGGYQLTSLGQKIGKATSSTNDHHIQRAYSIILMAVYHETNGWLLLRRNTHPLLDMAGFLQATPRAGLSLFDAAKQSLKEQTSLEADFSVAASGLMTICSEGEVESFINITLLKADSIRGTLQINNQTDNTIFWEKNPNWQSADMAPSLAHLVPLLDMPGVSVIDVTIDH